MERERQEATKALEQFKAQLARDVEERRHDAATTLEQFKAQLTLEAEVRRQVAAKKVAAILRFIDLGNSLIRKVLFPVLWVDGVSPNTFHETIEATDEYRTAFRDAEAFFDIDARQEILRFVEEVESLRDEKHHNTVSSTDASERAEAVRARFFQMLRRELQIEMGEKVETKS